MNPRHIMKWKMKKGKWRALALASALLLIGSGAAQAQVKVRGSVFGGGEKANVTGTDTVRIHGAVTDTVLGNVYGGGLQGHVSVNTVVEVSGGVIGTPGKTQNGTLNGIPVKPVANGGRVFGGGEGTELDRTHGWVAGNTSVTISGTAKVLRNVYGGGELASVGSGDLNDKDSGVTTVTIEGGEVGPLDGTGENGYVFAGGRGRNDDNDTYWNYANVDSASLVMTGGTVYGSLFGGAEDGHILGDATVNFSGGTLGTTGKTSWDGNIFGGGRNFQGIENSSGRVGGNTQVNVLGTAVVIGNVFGGGRLASVGIDENASAMQSGDDHGNTFVNISGGTIGLSTLDTVTSGSVFGGCMGNTTHTPGDLTKVALGHAKNTHVNISGGTILANVLGGSAYGTVQNNTNVTMTGGEIGRVVTGHTSNGTVIGGMVYGGGRGYIPDDVSTTSYNHVLYGIVMGNTNVNIKDGLVHGNVFGGGKNGSVGTYASNSGNVTVTNGATNVTVMGGTIGSSSVDDGMTGYVFGGGEGMGNDEHDYFKYHATVASTNVMIDSAAIVTSSVFGGGAEGHVWENTLVEVRGGFIGIDGQGLCDGSVYGGGGNMTETNFTAGRVGGNTHVIVQDSAFIYDNVYGGGYSGLLGVNGNGQVSDPATYGHTLVEIKGGTIGADQGEGHVFGGGKGSLTDLKYGYAANTEVSVSDAQINGNVYGGGELGKVELNTLVNVNSGVIGKIAYGKKQGNTGTVLDTIIHVSNSGMVFGGGKGVNTNPKVALVEGNTDVNINGGHVLYSVYGGGELASVGLADTTKASNGVIKDLYPKSGGYAKVTVNGGQVGPAPKKGTEGGITYDIPIGLNGTDGYVFGGGKGEGNDQMQLYPSVVPEAYKGFANVNYTCVTVNMPMPVAGDNNANRLWGSVFGGAEDGHVLGSDTVRYINGLLGTTGTTSYDGNIFGGGRNYSKKNYTAGRVRSNNTVVMSGGQIYGSIFGGGRLGITGLDYNGNVLKGDAYGQATIKINGGVVGNCDTIEEWTACPIGDVFGGGKGDMVGVENHPEASALLLSLVKNTEIIIQDSINGSNVVSPIIYGSVFGGGEVANVGQYTWSQDYGTGEISNVNLEAFGLAKITVSGGRIGLDKMRMSYNPAENIDVGHVFGGGEGIVDNPSKYAVINTVPFGDISLLNVMATVGYTEVTIKDNAWVKGSVYGGAENGHVLGNTSVKVQGGQIGSGEMPTGVAEIKFTEDQFLNADSLPECPHWPYGIKDALGVVHYNPQSFISTDEPSDGHTWFGNVFGGGSGYYPYIVESVSGDKTEVWNPYNGWIKGNTYVEISGGHILTSVYGGCENANVNGDSTVVVMTGGTVGVPRKLGQIGRHPVTCYLFGAGKGDPRAEFYDKTNVNGVRVDVKGGWIYGSVFGGGEDGHVLKDVKLFVRGNTGTNEQAIAGTATKIGTLGYSSVDGNIFGAGRGFVGNVLTAGGVRGEVEVNIRGGQMLGSIYGGGRLASVGLDFIPDTNPAYGYMLEDDSNGSHGHVTVNISGGVIGNEYESVTHHSANTIGGNVFGGGMGRFTKLDGTTNPIWPNLAKVKDVTVTVEGSDAVIMGNVYGGGEYGTVEEDAIVNVTGSTLWRDVYGGGFGSDKTDITGNLLVYTVSSGTVSAVQNESVTPMEMAGRVKGNTEVSVSGGWVKKSVYGGGELASVGTITSAEMHDASHPFNISWPYKFTYKAGTGTATVSVTGGRVGITGKDYMGPWDAIGGTPIGYDNNGTVYSLPPDEIDDQEEDNGDLYGAGKGISAERYTEAKCANVNTTSVTININSAADETNYKDLTLKYACITGAVYGGGENGHVNANATTTLTNGLIGHAVYGGGKGKGKYKAMVLNPSTGISSEQEIYSVTAGKVYGNTYININGGHVLRSVFGGGNLGSVGIGNYAGGVNDYNPAGYGELVTSDSQWADTTGTGHTYVNVLGGTIGMLPLDPTKPESVFKDGIPYGSVFGGCRGMATPDVATNEIAHLYESRPDVFLSYVNHTHVKIGDDTHSPRLYGSVFGGAQDGHIRWNSNVEVNNGVIGAEYGVDNVGSNDLTSVYWTDRGNVFGGGSGIGTYKDNGGTEHNSSVAGSITQSANTVINGGTIHRNVYGGGNLATIGPPRLTQDHDCRIDSTCVTVILNANANVGVHPEYGGNVYGASRGRASNTNEYENYALCSYTVVNINGAHILKNVYGGGENGQVGVANGDTLCHTATVNLNGGLIGTSTSNAHIFGGGQGVWGETGYENDTISGRVMGTATVNINDGEVTGNVYGGGQLGITYGETYANISGGTVDNHVFGAAWGKSGQVHVYGLRMVNMRKGLVKGNVYGGSYNADDALVPHPAAFDNNNTLETVSLVNYSGGTAMKHVFGAGDHGKSFGSTYVLVGLNAIMNAPPHTATTSATGYNYDYYADHGDLIITYDVWAGADFGESNTGTFGTNTITGRSDVYVDGYGYDTKNATSQNDNRYMMLNRSIFGCGTLNDGGRQGKQIMIRNYGHVIDNSGTTDPENYVNATRQLVAIQYADSLIVESSHIRLQGRGIVNYNIATEEYAIYNIFDRVRVVNGSSLFVDKPVNNIANLYSNLSSNLDGHNNPTVYPSQPAYTEVNYDGLTTEVTDNKIRINHGGYLTVSMTTTDNNGTTTLYGALRGFFHLMTDGVYNAFAYARPKQSMETGNIIDPSQYEHAYNTDGGFVSYRPTINIYDADGRLINGGNSVQMRYENHTPNQRSGDIYFRVWRFSEQAASVLEVVLHAIAKPNTDDYSYYAGTVTLPPRVNDNSIFRVKNNNGVAEINYGSEIALVNAGYQEEGTNWMYYDATTTHQFVMGLSEGNTNLDDGQDFMTEHPNNVFGLVAVPTGGLVATGSQPNQTMLICNESNDGVVATQWHNTVTTSAPQVKFILTHKNHITGNFSWDPISITMEQVDGTTVTDVVNIHVRIVTNTSIDQPNDVNTYAMMNHGAGSGDNHDIYRAKVLLPAFQLIPHSDTSTWTLRSVEWIPNTTPAPNHDVFDENTLVAGEPYGHYTPTRNFVGMTINPTINVDNTDGWWNDYTQINPIDLGAKKIVGGVNPIPSGGIYLGSTRGENPISFEFDLHYDSQQNIGLAGNAEMGTVKVTLHFTNYETAEGKDVVFNVKVLRRGKGKGFYIDGVNGKFNYSGRFPDAAQPSFAGILYFANDYEPVDSIYIVNKITVDPPVHLDWSTPYDEIRFYRYNGGHPLHQSEQNCNDKYFKDYLTTYVHPNPNGTITDPRNPAYKGVLIDVVSTMNIKSASVDGAYTLPECVGIPRTVNSPDSQIDTWAQLEDHVIADAPMFNLGPDAVLTVNGANDHPSDLRNNYNQVSNGGAAYLESGATLRMNKRAYINNNYVQDGASEEHHGGGAYLEGTASLMVSDDVMINTNKHVSNSKTEIDENVYLNDFNTLISVGSGSDTTFRALKSTSRIGVTKTAWNPDLYYMPVVFTEYNPYGENLITDGSYADNQIVFDQQQHYGLFEYPERKPNTDPFYDHKLYWVKTWVDCVTSIPDNFTASNIDSPEDLAWAISVANGYNGQSTAPTTNFTLTKDLDMSAYIWSPIGTTAVPYEGTFEGNGHVVTGLYSPMSPADKGMFGTTEGAHIQNLQVKVDFYAGNDVNNLGSIIGKMTGGSLSNCEGAGYLKGGENTVNIGGLVGLFETKDGTSNTIHSSFATDTLHSIKPEANYTSDTKVGGLVGTNYGNLYNSYSNFTLDDESWQYGSPIGGLASVNRGVIENCYSHLQGSVSATANYGWFTCNNDSVVKYCYAPSGTTAPFYTQSSQTGSTLVGHGTYGNVFERKAVGYMYDDNKVTAAATATLTDTLFIRKKINYEGGRISTWSGLVSSLNQWVVDQNTNHGGSYTSWFRPTTEVINGDLPVLGFPKDNAMATLDADGLFLRYGATDFDATTHAVAADGNNGLDILLDAFADKTASIFLYDNATNVTKVPTTNEKVFVNEDAVLMQAANATGEFINTTVGITFDNSCRNNTTSNDQLGTVALNYDWHLLSTPLNNAPLGISYDETLPNYYTSPVDVNGVSGSYFPDNLPTSLNTEPRWDIYTYYEHHYHWINLKRKSANHWHYDYANQNIPYYGDGTTLGNETRFVPAKGYMMAIEKDSYLSNTGMLTQGEVTIPVTATAPDAGLPAGYSYNKGSNLVGNPFQAYLDLDKVSEGNVFDHGSTKDTLKYFYIYDADQHIYAPYTKTASSNPRIPSQYIHPHQGFFVLYKPKEAENHTVTMSFKPSMAGTQKEDESYFRGKVNYPVVNIIAENEIGERDLAVVELGRPEIGGVEKVENLQNSEFKLYSRLENNNYALLFTPVGTPRIPLFFKTPTDGNYKLTWDTHNGTYSKLILVDNITGVQYDMLTHDHYDFVAYATDYAARFYILFSVAGTYEIDNDTHGNFAFFDGTNWVIDGSGQLELLDVTGRVLYTNYLSGDRSHVNLKDVAAGTYLLRLVEGKQNVKVQKIVIY